MDITRYDIIRQVGVDFQYTLLELLPLAPTSERSNNIWTAYYPNTREYTVVVQDYPYAGMDTFFTATIGDDVTSAKAVLSNVIIGHPDASAGNPGKMTLRKIMYCPEGHHLALFDDGSLHHLDLVNKSYKQIANVKSSSKTVGMSMTNAHVIENNILKSVLYDPVSYISYLVKTNFEEGTASEPLQIQQLRGSLGVEKPLAAHMVYDPTTKANRLTVIYNGNFDQILNVDETTGEQTVLFSDMYNQVNGSPVEFQCTTSTKDCDTLWSTTAYDPKNNALYMQIHQIEGDMSTTYIYNSKYYQNHVTKAYYPILNPSVTGPIFGFSGYQWVTINN